MKKVAIILDSECGWTEKEARDRGFGFVPIIIIIDGKEGYSGVDYTLEYIYENLKKETNFKTSTSTLGMFEEEYRAALKDAEHVLFLGISKHLSSQNNSAKLVADMDEFAGKVTVYDTEFIGPWLLRLTDKLVSLMEEDADLNKILKMLDSQRGNMYGWLLPKNLDRVYSGGRLSKAQYIAGSLLKITPVMPVINGSISDHGIVKTRSIDKGLEVIVNNTVNKYKEMIKDGKRAEILITCLGNKDEKYDKIVLLFKEKGFDNITLTWCPAAIVGHVGLGGIGAGIGIDPEDE